MGHTQVGLGMRSLATGRTITPWRNKALKYRGRLAAPDHGKYIAAGNNPALAPAR